MSSNITAEKEIKTHFSHISRMTTVVSTSSQGFSPQRQTTWALRSTTQRRETESSLCLLLCNCWHFLLKISITPAYLQNHHLLLVVCLFWLHGCIKPNKSAGNQILCVLHGTNKSSPVQAQAEAGSKMDLARDLLSQHLHSCSWWKEKNAVWPLSPFSYSHLGTLLSLLIRGNNYQSGQVIKLKHKWLHELGWLYYKVFPGLIKEKYGSAHPRCHRAGEKEEKKKSSCH